MELRIVCVPMIVIFLLLASGCRGKVLKITGAKAVVNGAKSLTVEFTVTYNGNDKMKNRLIDGRYLSIRRLNSYFMDKDFIGPDSQLEIDSTPVDVYMSKVDGQFRSLGHKADIEDLWDVIAFPSITVRRTYDIEDKKFLWSREQLFRHEIINGKRSWFGRLHRVGYDRGWPQEPNSIAALAVGDVVYAAVNGLRLCIRWATAYTIGKDTMCADVFSRPDIYMIVDIVFRDSIGLDYRLVFETRKITMPDKDGLIDSTEGDSEYEENGRLTTPGFVDLSNE